MSVFYCDSNCELWYDQVDELGIKFISMPYTIDGEEYYYDLGKNTDLHAFFEKMRKGAVAKTSALNMTEYVEIFEPDLKAGEDVIYVTFSHKMSGTFSSLQKAIDELATRYPDRKITVVDSKGISVSAGMVVYFSAKLHNEGASDEEVVKFVESFRDKVKCYFTVADLEYLKRGGRLSGAAALFGKILDIKPIISNVDGKLESVAKVKGRKNALKRLTGALESDGVDTSYPIVVLEADNEKDKDIVYDYVKEHYPDAKIWVTKIGPVIGSHCGPDTIGLIFVANK
ncbi:MAG: DegV family protein [Clostridia bacterium]|nr:DegV family protein [Clostridia bacterium]